MNLESSKKMIKDRKESINQNNKFNQNDIDIKVYYTKPFNEDCVICLETNNDNCILPCCHLLCKSCCYLWLKSKKLCPVCKRPVKEKV